MPSRIRPFLLMVAMAALAALAFAGSSLSATMCCDCHNSRVGVRLEAERARLEGDRRDRNHHPADPRDVRPAGSSRRVRPRSCHSS